MEKSAKLPSMTATPSGLRPADFPLKSVESRAAARMLVDAKRSKSQPAGDVYPPGWSPKTAAQQSALESSADIQFFGGAAGSLKTETMLVDAARESNNPNLRAIIFRQQFTQMTDIVDKTLRLYKPMGANFVGAPSWTWTFPSGAKIRLAYISTDKDIWEYLGPRYSFIGFDESTFHSEYQVRNMLGRLSSTDKTLRLRKRLASNPGGIGAAWHKTMFLRGACPVHNPQKSADPGKLYWDGCWPSDQYPLVDENGHGFSIAFIPGRLSDHNLRDDKYVYLLRMMSGSLSAAMEQGCWCELQDTYFANWKASKMVIPYGEWALSGGTRTSLVWTMASENRVPRLIFMYVHRMGRLRQSGNLSHRIYRPMNLRESWYDDSWNQQPTKETGAGS